MFTLGIDAFSSRTERSGVEWYAYHLLRAMKQESPPDWRVFLYAMGSDDFTNDITHDDWKWKKLGWPPRRGWEQIRLSWEMIRRSPNVLFVPAAMIPLVHPHGAWRKKHTVTTIHDVAFLQHPELYAPADRRRQEVALSFASHHASLLFVPTEATKVELQTQGIDSQKICVTPLGIDHGMYQPTINEMAVQATREKYQLHKPYLIYVGRLDAKKNLPTLIRAFAAWEGAKEHQLILAGSPCFGFEEIDRVIKEQKIEERVRLLGFVSETDLPSLYHGARAFVFSSMAEGFGLPVLQAMATGTPIVTSDISALREVAGESAVFVDPKDQQRWTTALDSITRDESLRADLRAKGIARAAEFSWKKTAQLTWEAIRNLL